jgi:hypothetical protein
MAISSKWRRRSLWAGLAFAAAACGGGGRGSTATIPISLDISEQTIQGYAPDAAQAACNPAVPGLGSLGPDSIVPITFDIRASQELAGQPLPRFAKVSLDHVILTIVPPSQQGQTWDFLDSIELFAHAVGSSDPPVLVAKLDPVPNGKTEIEIPGTGVDIRKIVSADKFEITGQVSGRPPCADVHFVGKADFDVGV